MHFKEIMCLWKDGKLPMVNGLIKSNDTFFSLSDGGLQKSSPLPRIDSVNISNVDFMPPLKTNQYIIYFGGGNWGSDGWLLFLSEKRDLCWLLSGDINPIETATVNGSFLHAMNNNNVQFLIPLFSPEKMERL